MLFCCRNHHTRPSKYFTKQSLCGLRTEVSKIRQPGHYILLPAPLSGFLHIQLTLYYGWTFVQFSLIAAATAFLLDSDRVIGKQSLLTATIPNFTSGMFIMILFLLDFLQVHLICLLTKLITLYHLLYLPSRYFFSLLFSICLLIKQICGMVNSS